MLKIVYKNFVLKIYIFTTFKEEFNKIALMNLWGHALKTHAIEFIWIRNVLVRKLKRYK